MTRAKAAVSAFFAVMVIALPAAVASSVGTPQDKAVLAAHDAFLAGDRVKLARYAEKIRGHVLEPYINFWRLKLRLEEADPDEVRDFLSRHAGTLFADRLRREWLRLLGKNGTWDLFSQEHPLLVKDDPDIACYALQGRWYRQNDLSVAEIKPFWRAAKNLPDGCIPPAEAMLRSGALGVRDLRDRFRLLVNAGLVKEAKWIAEHLPGDQAPQGERIDAVMKAPIRFLERNGADARTAFGRELVIAAVTRLAQDDPLNAAHRWDGGLRERFPLEDQQYVWAIIATQGARRHLPEALDWFRRAGETPLTDEQLAWRARIALRQEAWPEVKGAIERMSPPLNSEPTWIYWLGRSVRALGSEADGQALLRRIAGEHHFYGRLAAEELGMPLMIPPKAEPPTKDELSKVAALPGLQRALALHRLGLRSEATLEWVWTVREMDDRALLAAAEIARLNKIWDRAIYTADRTVAAHDFTLRYPAPYHDILAQQARVRHLDEPWVLGLVRQESRFIADAKSPMGARGLMQLLPSTARWVARKIGMKGYHPSRVSLPKVNATLGAFYLSHVLDWSDGNPVLAAAAYNAGPARARRWRDLKPLEGAIYIETIPFPETRHYVKKVMANTVYYAALFGGEQRTLKSRLGTISAGTQMRAEAGG